MRAQPCMTVLLIFYTFWQCDDRVNSISDNWWAVNALHLWCPWSESGLKPISLLSHRTIVSTISSCLEWTSVLVPQRHELVKDWRRWTLRIYNSHFFVSSPIASSWLESRVSHISFQTRWVKFSSWRSWEFLLISMLTFSLQISLTEPRCARRSDAYINAPPAGAITRPARTMGSGSVVT